MNLLNLIEDTNTGFENLRALISASQTGQDAVLNIGGETVTLDPMEVRWMFSKYKAFNKAGRQQEFIDHLGDAVKFDQHMKQLRQLIDKQKNFRGSVPGQRGVTGDVPQGMAEGPLEEIALQDPNNPTQQMSGKINWTRMIQDYKANKPLTEFEFGTADRPLTIYRSQMYAILKAFGNMKPQQKINIITNVFGNKVATIEYLDKLRAKGLMPKKVPAYVDPDKDPVPPGQMNLPGITEDQKKSPEDLSRAVNPKVARAFQLARAQQPGADSDIEAFVRNELDKGEIMAQQIDSLQQDNEQQSQQIATLTKAISARPAPTRPAPTEPSPAPTATVTPTAPDVRPPDREREKDEPRIEPRPTAKKPDRAPAPMAPAPDLSVTQPEPVPAPAPEVKPPKQDQPLPEPDIDFPDNVVQFPATGTDGRRKKKTSKKTDADELGAAMAGLEELPRAVGQNENHKVTIKGNTLFEGKTGSVTQRIGDNFFLVDVDGFGSHAFHVSRLIFEMQTKMDRFNINRGTPGGTTRQREDFLDARDRLFRQMNSASPGEKEAIRLKIADLEGQAQAQGIKIREAGEFNRAGYNAIRDVSDWEEKMRVMRELTKDTQLMSDPEARSAIEQRIGDLIRVGQQQGYVTETLNDKAMAVLRSLQQPTQPAPAAVDLNVPASAEPKMDLATVRKKIAQLDELIRMKELIDKLFIRAQNVRGGIYPGLQADIEMEELYPTPQTDQQFQDLRDKYTKDLAALQKFLAMKKAVYREDEDSLSESTALVRLKQARQQLAQQGVTEGHADQQRKIFKKNGRPVGEVGIDRESSPGVGQWYMKCYAYDIDNSGYDSYEEAVAELKHCLKQGVAEGFEYGNRVQHPKYGAGQVVKVYRNGTITVNFPDYPDPIDKKPGVQSNFAPGDSGYQSLKPMVAEKQDACYHKVKSRYKVWPSAYASGALVQCRKKGAANWGTGGKKK